MQKNNVKNVTVPIEEPNLSMGFKWARQKRQILPTPNHFESAPYIILNLKNIFYSGNENLEEMIVFWK